MKIAIIVAIVVLVLFLIVAISISSNSFMKFKQIFEEYQNVKNSSYLTAEQFAEFVRDKNLVADLELFHEKANFLMLMIMLQTH